MTPGTSRRSSVTNYRLCTDSCQRPCAAHLVGLWGVIQAAAPLGFWRLDAATVYGMIIAVAIVSGVTFHQ